MPTIIIKPSQISTKDSFVDTVWQNSEKETVARNIVIICRKHNDSWEPFSADEYSLRCGRTNTSKEISILDDFVRDRYLAKNGKKYSVTNNFIAALAKYVKE